MTQSKIAHLIALLGSLATAVLPAWIDPAQTVPAKVALTAATLLFLCVSTAKVATYSNALFGGLAVASVIVAGIVGKFSAGSAGFAVGGFLLALIAQLRIVFAAKLGQTPNVVVPIVTPRDPKAGHAAPSVLFTLAFCTLVCLLVWCLAQDGPSRRLRPRTLRRPLLWLLNHVLGP